MKQAIQELHSEVADKDRHLRNLRLRKQKKRLPNFNIGTYVMVAAHEANKGKRQHKAQVLWHGPYEIVSTLSPFVYICRLVGQDKTITVHVDRIKRFASKEFQMPPELIHSAQSDAASFEVEKIVG